VLITCTVITLYKITAGRTLKIMLTLCRCCCCWRQLIIGLFLGIFHLGEGRTNSKKKKTVFKLQRVKNIQQECHQYIYRIYIYNCRVCLGFKLTKVLKNNASSKDTGGKIPKQTLKCQQKVTKMSKTVKERMDRQILLLGSPSDHRKLML